jgi:hypothetical protein
MRIIKRYACSLRGTMNPAGSLRFNMERKKALAGTGQGKRFEDSPTTQGTGNRTESIWHYDAHGRKHSRRATVAQLP